MTLVFLTNLINHHQIPLADELYLRLGDDYKYISYDNITQELLTGGYDANIQRPYLVNGRENYNFVQELIDNADVVIIGSVPDYLVKTRLDRNKLTFHYSERWFKHFSYHMLSPRYWWHIYKYHFSYRNKKSYMLCASAYTAKDVNRIWCYRHKCYKWGYFTKVDKLDIDLLISNKRAYSVRIVWCARFIKWKHPELVIKLAKKLKQNNYNVKIDMYGSGEMLDDIKQLATSLDVMDVVSFMGNRANEDILRLFRNYHIFIFTSDRNEGWGAVLNEAMSNGCAVVASDEIGSVPYLIEDYKNGLLFKSKSLDSLYQKVETMISDSTLREAISRNAYETMHNLWSPKIAAENLLNLITYINNGSKGKYNIMQGPCSYDY